MRVDWPGLVPGGGAGGEGGAEFYRQVSDAVAETLDLDLCVGIVLAKQMRAPVRVEHRRLLRLCYGTFIIDRQYSITDGAPSVDWKLYDQSKPCHNDCSRRP